MIPFKFLSFERVPGPKVLFVSLTGLNEERERGKGCANVGEAGGRAVKVTIPNSRTFAELQHSKMNPKCAKCQL